MKRKPDEDPDAPTRREQAKATLIEAAIGLFADHDDVTVREIAEVAGLNHALVHYYFGSKEALRTAAFLHAASAAAASLRLQPTAAPELIASRVFAMGLSNQPAIRILVREVISADLDASAPGRRPAPVAEALMPCFKEDAGQAGREAFGAASAVWLGFLIQRNWMKVVLKLDDDALARVQATCERQFADLLRPFVRGAG